MQLPYTTKGKEELFVSINKRRSSLNFGEKVMFLAGILFCLVLITTAMLGGLFARYASTEDGADLARVAKFDVAAALDKEELSVFCTKSIDQGSFIITVSSKSEVAVSYDLVVQLDEILPEGITAQLQAGEQLLTQTASEDGLTLTFSQEGTMPANPDTPRSYTLSFLVDWETFTKKNRDAVKESETAEIGFTVIAEIVQID